MQSVSFRQNWSTFWAMVRKELLVMARYPVELVASFGQIFLIVAIFTLAGLTFSSTGSSNSQTSGVVTYGFILFIFLSDTLWTIGYHVRQEQIQGTLEQLYLSPASKFASLVSRATNILLWTGSLSLLAALIMRSMLGTLPVHNINLGLFLFGMTLSGTFGLGFAFAALTLRLREAAQTLANLLQFAFLILCANFFPFSALPPAIRFVSRLIPLSYGVDSFRSAMMGFPPGFPELAPINTEIVIVTLFGILMPLIGYVLFHKAELYARKKGSLGQF